MRKQQKRRTVLWGLGLTLACVAFTRLLALTGLLEVLEGPLWSYRVRLLAGPGPASDRIALVLLDQGSLDWGSAENGWPWPWPREVYSALITFCRRGGARCVVLDFLFSESSWAGVEDDQTLARALAGGGEYLKGAPVAVGLFLGSSARQATTWPSEVPKPLWKIQGLSSYLKENPGVPFFHSAAAFPVPELAGAASGLGTVQAAPGFEGTIRKVFLFQGFSNVVIPALGIVPYLLEKRGAPQAAIQLKKGELRIGERRIPVDRNLRAIVRYRPYPGTYETFSAAAVIQSELRIREGETPAIDPSIFKDKYVFFGSSAPGLGDIRATPVADTVPGVVVHATVLDNLLSGDFIRPSPAGVPAVVTFLCAALGYTLMLLARRVYLSGVVFVGVLGAIAASGFVAYGLGMWLPVAGPAAAALCAMVSASVYNYATEGRQRRFIKDAFSRYLSPQVIERILADPSSLKLGGERRQLTIFFSDLQGFSSIAEKLKPEALTSLLNDYLSDMTDIVLEEGGTLDKYEGDAIIAFWNAPLAQEDHAARACRAALRCQQKLSERKEHFALRAGRPLCMRIGIHTGPVVVGNMGSRRRFDYTVLGDAANVASRLEGANKAFGTATMVSEGTIKRTGGAFPIREIGLIRVVGRRTPLRVFELRRFHEEKEAVGLYEEALELLRKDQVREALERFKALAEDPVAAKYAQKCRELLEGAVWDGVWNLSEK